MPVSKKRCKHCRVYHSSKSGFKTNFGWFCSKDHALEFAKQKNQERANKAKQSKCLNQRQIKAKPASTSELKKKAQESVNRYIRIRDSGNPCPSCFKSEKIIESEQGWRQFGCWDAGHYLSVGSNPELRFNTLNIHRQCRACNAGENHNGSTGCTTSQNYRKSLIQRLGINCVENLERNSSATNKKDGEYLKRLTSIFNKKYQLYAKRFRN